MPRKLERLTLRAIVFVVVVVVVPFLAVTGDTKPERRNSDGMEESRILLLPLTETVSRAPMWLGKR